MSTAHRITNLLNRKTASVLQLAEELNISRNSVHLQVSKLEAAGIVEKVPPDPEKATVGKPAQRYRLRAQQEDAFSTAHRSVLGSLVRSLGSEISEKTRIRLLEKTGVALAQDAQLQPSGELEADAQRAVDEVNKLGAMAELESQGSSCRISCHSCPLGSLVHEDEHVCKLVAAFFAESTGRQVKVNCSRNETVVCGFSIE